MTRLLAMCVSETKVLENALGYKVKIPPVLNQFSNLSNSFKSSLEDSLCIDETLAMAS